MRDTELMAKWFALLDNEAAAKAVRERSAQRASA